MKRLEEQLTEVTKPSVDLPLHRAHLRRTLLASKRFEGSPFSFMSLFKLAPAALVLTFVFGLSFIVRPQEVQVWGTPRVSAQEMLATVVEEFQALTSEEVQALDARLGVSFGAILTEAHGAEDLHLLDLESSIEGGRILYAFTKTEGGEYFEFEVSIEQSEDSSWENLYFLEYSRLDGTQVQFALNPEQDWLPLVVFVMNSEEFGMNPSVVKANFPRGLGIGIHQLYENQNLD